jgi:DNA topoisomerase-3
VGKEEFSCTGKTLISPGFTSVMTWQALAPDENLPNCSVGEKCEISEVSSNVLAGLMA